MAATPLSSPGTVVQKVVRGVDGVAGGGRVDRRFAITTSILLAPRRWRQLRPFAAS
jgi:hypothetical protein